MLRPLQPGPFAELMPLRVAQTMAIWCVTNRVYRPTQTDSPGAAPGEKCDVYDWLVLLISVHYGNTESRPNQNETNGKAYMMDYINVRPKADV